MASAWSSDPAMLKRSFVYAFAIVHPWTRSMFRLISNLVLRYPRAVLLAWLGLIAGLHCFAPPWNRTIRDDDLGLFPADSPSMIARAFLERGFPQDASSSELVMVYRREDGRLTSGDFRFVEAEAASISRFARQHPDLGVKKIDTYRSPVIGPRLIGSRGHGAAHTVLSIVSLDSGYLSRKTQRAVDRILERVNTETHSPRRDSSGRLRARRPWGVTPTRRPMRALRPRRRPRSPS